MPRDCFLDNFFSKETQLEWTTAEANSGKVLAISAPAQSSGNPAAAVPAGYRARTSYPSFEGSQGCLQSKWPLAKQSQKGQERDDGS